MTTAFDHLRQRAREDWEALQHSPRPRILVGGASCGRSAGSALIAETFRREADRHRVDCDIIEVGCMGLCHAEPIVCVSKPGRPGICYGCMTPQKVVQLIESYLIDGDPPYENALGTVGNARIPGIHRLSGTPVFRLQARRILRNCGFIDPANINHYVANGGYGGLARALGMAPGEIVDELKVSGLRGRGGAGFPTWKKWQFSQQVDAPKRFVICNGSEGDPGVFSNRLLLESDPHSVLEGMLIAGYAIGADEGYVYCPADYPLALERLRIAVRQMEENGFLGESILGSSFNFSIRLKEGAGAYVCGEETALIECIEGKRGMPRARPPFPPVSGLWNKPTIVNNVETLACVTLVLQNGATWFGELGSGSSKGTKLFCLSGSTKYLGTIEVPLGITLQEIVYQIGGGTFDGRRIKAVQIGGPGGGWLPRRLLNIGVDHESLLEVGASLGSGGVVAVGENTCMVDVALDSLNFAQKESCGQCVPCRLGTRQLFEIMKDITQGRGLPQDIELLVELADGIRLGSLCGLGQTVLNPMLSTIRHFRDEYEAHVREKTCPAGVCNLTASVPELV